MNIPKVVTVVKELGLEPRSTLCAVKISGGALVGHAEAELKARLESYAADRNLALTSSIPNPNSAISKRAALIYSPNPTPQAQPFPKPCTAKRCKFTTNTQALAASKRSVTGIWVGW